MTGADIQLINEIWRESLKQQAKRKKLYDCPFAPMTYNSTSGLMRKERVECRYGKGIWCKFCARHTKWQKQNSSSRRTYFNKKTHILDSYDKTGLVPYLRPKPNPEKITNPLGGIL